MKDVPVIIRISRGKNGQPEGKVEPDPVEIRLNEKDNVEWKLQVSPDYKDAAADIEKKRPNDDWPFDTEPPKKIKKDNPKKSGAPKSNAKRKNQYSVRCTVMDGTTPIEFVIDPDIIIIGGAFE
jgi:hypothetical protein